MFSENNTLKELTDEISAIKDELINCRDILKYNLESKEVSTSGINNIKDLIESVSNIELGKKWASGVSPYSGTYRRIIISGLNFRPSNIIAVVIDPSAATKMWYGSVYSNYVFEGNKTANVFLASSSGGSGGFKIDGKILDNGFDINCETAYSGYDTRWIAFE